MGHGLVIGILQRAFPQTEREGAKDWARYVWCRIIGHRIVEDDRPATWCVRCGDTMPDGLNRWQP